MPTKNISIDIKQCSGYASLSDGTHNLQLRAKYSWRTGNLSATKSMIIDSVPNNYLEFECPVPFTLSVQGTKQWNGKIYYYFNSTWNEWDGTSALSPIVVGSTYRIRLVGIYNTKISNSSGYFKFTTSYSIPNIIIRGTLDCLLDYRYVDNGVINTNIDVAYSYLFANNPKIKEADNLILRSSLYYGIYGHLFANCTGLVKAPSLPATTLATYCYYEMFAGCSSLTNAPQLPATTLAQYCYAGMFKNCTSLTAQDIPIFPVIDYFPSYCCQEMFKGCTGIKIHTSELIITPNTYRIPASGWTVDIGTDCLKDMFTGTSGGFTGTPQFLQTYYLEQTPNLENAITFEETRSGRSFNVSFYSDEILTHDGRLAYSVDDGATWIDLSQYAIISVPNGKISIIGRGNTYFRSNNSTYGGFQFYTDARLKCSGNIDTLLDYAKFDKGQFISKGYYTFRYLFANCPQLLNTPAFSSSVERNCYEGTFMNCTNLVGTEKLPAMTLKDSCYRDMFRGCTSLKATPILPATTLAPHCYDSMFRGCTSLWYICKLPATDIPDYAYQNMFNGCSSLAIYTSQNATQSRYPFMIPSTGWYHSIGEDALWGMFMDVGGNVPDTPTALTTYYARNRLINENYSPYLYGWNIPNATDYYFDIYNLTGSKQTLVVEASGEIKRLTIYNGEKLRLDQTSVPELSTYVDDYLHYGLEYDVYCYFKLVGGNTILMEANL